MYRFIKRVGCYLAISTAIFWAPSTCLVAQEGRPEDRSTSAQLTMDQVNALLTEARQAMSQGDLAKAESLLQKAEAAHPKYPVLHFGDTPARVRHDLEKLAASRANPGKPVTPSLPGAATANPFAAKQTTQSALPPIPSAEGEPVAAETTPHVALPSPDRSAATRAQCDQLLLATRQALVVGDVAQAETLLNQAQACQVSYGETEESPARVAQSVEELRQLECTKDASASWKHSYAKFLVSQADVLFTCGDLENAERAASEAAGLMTAVGLQDAAPIELLGRIGEARRRRTKNPTDQTASIPAAARPLEGAPRDRLILDQAVAPTTAAVPIDLTLPNIGDRGVPKIAQLPAEAPEPLPSASEELVPEKMDAFALLQEGEIALRAGRRTEALRLFRAAHKKRNELDLASQQQLQDHLQMLSSGPNQNNSGSASLIDSATSGNVMLARQLSAEIGKRQTEAARLRQTDPRESLKTLQDAEELVNKSELDSNTKKQLLRRLGLSIAETERYIKEHGAEIDLDEANQKALADVDRERSVRQQVREKMAEMVDQFNQLVDEHRYAEAEVIAQRLYELAPEEPVAQQVWQNAKFIRRTMLNRELDALAEEGFVKTQQDIRESASKAMMQASDPITYDADTWDRLKDRKPSSDASLYQSERELQIERKLNTPVLPNYNDMPLSQVMDGLSKLTGINIHLDPRGLDQEGIQLDTPVSLNLGQEISLKSALNLILEPLHLTYMIKDEVLKVTSEQIRDGELIVKPYNVADLVIPIPNFVPTNNMGLQGLINDAYAAIPFSNGARESGPVAMVPTAPPNGQVGGAVPGSAMAQQFGANNTPGASSVPLGGGPGGLGGAANADFDSLIDLIVSTVEYDSWMENGSGEGEIQPFPTNLSLVISQTQRVHEQIADLLEQLRRLQDLQVTIEVRFIRLTDSFFERIGIDFDFNVQDGTNLTDAEVADPATPPSASATVGISAMPTSLADPLPDFTVGLDVPFRDNSFGLTTPQFGGNQTVGEFGFAILSDIEAFFLINASQGDQRANVLQAPKVTLFNGQQGIVADTSLRPFVISVIPVVGEFAAAQQPVIVVLSEGTLLSVQAVVSDDRRYVRLTLVPFFSQIGDVDTFTFEGTSTTSSSSNTTDANEDGNDETSDTSQQTITSGTTVQLPTFQIITVATTVSVPDGGTVLLGGVKRLREGRNEFGVPLLSKVPYIDRLFRNVGIGRETDSLMMMVTPHIIIQEEEEERLGITPQ